MHPAEEGLPGIAAVVREVSASLRVPTFRGVYQSTKTTPAAERQPGPVERYTPRRLVADTATREVGVALFADDPANVAWLDDRPASSAKSLLGEKAADES